MDGFVNSQTWEAWFESYEVLWHNTSYIFVISVLVSLVIAIATYMMPFGTRSAEIKANEDEDVTHEEKDDQGNILEDNCQAAEIKNAQRIALEKNMEKQMTDDQRRAERDAQSQQLAAIFKMMQEQEDKFGKTSIDDIKDQMKLYCG